MNTRYYIEHEFLPKTYYKDPLKLITKVLTEKEKYLYNLYLAMYEKAHEPCPYQEREFKIETKAIEQVEFIIMTLPEIYMEPTLCHKIVLAYSMNMDLYQYFTLEDGNDPLFGHYMQLCAWMEGSHVNFGDFKEEDDITAKIYQTMMM